MHYLYRRCDSKNIILYDNNGYCNLLRRYDQNFFFFFCPIVVGPNRYKMFNRLKIVHTLIDKRYTSVNGVFTGDFRYVCFAIRTWWTYDEIPERFRVTGQIVATRRQIQLGIRSDISYKSRILRLFLVFDKHLTIASLL